MATTTQLKKSYSDYCKENVSSYVDNFVKEITEELDSAIKAGKFSVSKTLITPKESDGITDLERIAAKKITFKLEDMELYVSKESVTNTDGERYLITVEADF